MKKIGIITFHWATNYGAVLQSYCLQEFLKECGLNVEIINYKPRIYDKTWNNFLKNPRNIKKLLSFPIERKKERLLEEFRAKHLNMSRRFYTCYDLEKQDVLYDIIISGSDQILNPAFTTSGEGTSSSAYYISFGNINAKRIGYAVSFGCEMYPEKASTLAERWINNFDIIGVRENSGLKVLKQLKFEKKKEIVPDPTILYGPKLFTKLGINQPKEKSGYTCVYMLRHEISIKGLVRYIDDKHKARSMQDWLHLICNAKNMITNSYHGMIMAILSHVPFVALLDEKKQGMNDRFVTLLNTLNLSDRIGRNQKDIDTILSQSIDWEQTDKLLSNYSQFGRDFLLKEIK